MAGFLPDLVEAGVLNNLVYKNLTSSPTQYFPAVFSRSFSKPYTDRLFREEERERD